jgi:hypothetical protein
MFDVTGLTHADLLQNVIYSDLYDRAHQQAQALSDARRELFRAQTQYQTLKYVRFVWYDELS